MDETDAAAALLEAEDALLTCADDDAAAALLLADANDASSPGVHLPSAQISPRAQSSPALHGMPVDSRRHPTKKTPSRSMHARLIMLPQRTTMRVNIQVKYSDAAEKISQTAVEDKRRIGLERHCRPEAPH